jgi:hypothetical protein
VGPDAALLAFASGTPAAQQPTSSRSITLSS